MATWQGDGDLYASPVLSADGSRIYAVTSAQNAAGGWLARVVELDASTGRQLQVLYDEAMPTPVTYTATALARDPTGTALMVADFQGAITHLDLATGQVTHVPASADTHSSPSIAW